MDALLTNQYTLQHSDNLFSEALTFDSISVAFNVVAGAGSALPSVIKPFAGDNCLKITNSNTSTADIVCELSNTDGRFTAPFAGNFLFSFVVKNPTYNQVASTGSIRIFKNGLTLYDLDFNTGDVYDQWQTFMYNIELESDDYIDLRFIFKQNVSSPVTNNYLFLDGFQLEYNDGSLTNPTIYSFPLQYKLNGWTINRDFTNNQALTADVETLITFPNTNTESQGGLSLADTNGKVMPVSTGDAYHICYRFTTIAPAASATLSIVPKSGSIQVKEGRSLILSDTDSAEQMWNYEFTIPITGSDLADDETNILENGIVLYGTCTENVTITDKRIEVIRILRGL